MWLFLTCDTSLFPEGYWPKSVCCWSPSQRGFCLSGLFQSCSWAQSWWITLPHCGCYVPVDRTPILSPSLPIESAVIRFMLSKIGQYSWMTWRNWDWWRSDTVCPSPGTSSSVATHTGGICPAASSPPPFRLRKQRLPLWVWWQSLSQIRTGRENCSLCWFKWRSWKCWWDCERGSAACWRIWTAECRLPPQLWGSCIGGRSFDYGSSSSSTLNFKYLIIALLGLKLGMSGKIVIGYIDDDVWVITNKNQGTFVNTWCAWWFPQWSSAYEACR